MASATSFQSGGAFGGESALLSAVRAEANAKSSALCVKNTHSAVGTTYLRLSPDTTIDPLITPITPTKERLGSSQPKNHTIGFELECVATSPPGGTLG